MGGSVSLSDFLGFVRSILRRKKIVFNVNSEEDFFILGGGFILAELRYGIVGFYL